MKTIVLVTRHPDYADNIEVFDGDEIGAEIIYVDLGSSFDSKPDDHEQWVEWSGYTLDDIMDLPADHGARKSVETLIRDLAQEDLTPELYVQWLSDYWLNDETVEPSDAELFATMLRVFSDDPRSLFIELDERPGKFDPKYAEGDWHWKLRQARNLPDTRFFELI